MKTLKVVIGSVLALFSTITIFEMFSEENGAGLFGAISGYVLIMAIAVWLIYSGLKDNKIKIKNTNAKVNYKADDSLQNLSDLKQKGIITDEEYKNKIDKIEAEKIKHNLKNSVEYKQLKNLLDNGILSKEEFECKIQLLQNVSEKELGFKNNISTTNSDTNNYYKNTLRKTFYKIDNKNYSIESLILELESNNLELWRNTVVELEDGTKKRLDEIKDLSFIIKKYFPPKN